MGRKIERIELTQLAFGNRKLNWGSEKPSGKKDARPSAQSGHPRLFERLFPQGNRRFPHSAVRQPAERTKLTRRVIAVLSNPKLLRRLLRRKQTR